METSEYETVGVAMLGKVIFLHVLSKTDTDLLEKYQTEKSVILRKIMFFEF